MGKGLKNKMISRDEMVHTLTNCKELKQIALSNIEWLVTRMVKDKHYICEPNAFAFYIKCNDEVLDKIRTDIRYVTDPTLIKDLLSGEGRHVHFIGVWTTDKASDGFQSIARGLKDIVNKENPKTVSWYNRTLNKFIIRRIICQQ